jgi:Protein of unknown function DUF262
MTRQTAAPLVHQALNATNREAKFFVQAVQDGDIILDAPYQRGDVWTEDQRIGLIRSWLTGLPIPAVIINDRMSHAWVDAHPDDVDRLGPAYAVIDGAQRIRTAIAWFTGELAVPASWFDPDHLDTAAVTDDGAYVRYTGLTVVGRRIMANRCLLPCAEGRLATVEQEAEVYLIVNGQGTPQTDTDMQRAARIAGE